MVDVEHVDAPQQNEQRLNEGEEAEAQRVADDDLYASRRRRHQSFHRSLHALAQERDAGEQEDEEEDEERDVGGSEQVEDVKLRPTIEVALLDVDGRHTAARDAGSQFDRLLRRL